MRKKNKSDGNLQRQHNEHLYRKKKPTINSNMGDTKHLTKLLAFIEIEFYKRRVHQGPRWGIPTYDISSHR